MGDFTEQALDLIARAAADMLIARERGDLEGAQAAENQARIIRDNPRSRKH